MFEAIEAAQDYLLLQVYILRDDDLGRDLKARLTRRARDGLRIYMLYDEIGSYGLPHLVLSELSSAGVVVRPFCPPQGAVHRFQLTSPNPRTTLVSDTPTALFCCLAFRPP